MPDLTSSKPFSIKPLSIKPFSIKRFTCQPPASKRSGLKLSCSIVAAVLLAIAATPAAAVDLPLRKPGLWELTMTRDGGRMPAIAMQHCTDETTDKQMNNMSGAMQKDMCAKNDIQKTATGYVVDAVCTAGGISMTTHSEITGDFNSAYTVKVSSQNTGGPAGMPRDTGMTLEAKWLGACKADQKPGDIMMPGGMKMNVKDMDALRGATRKP